jgi:hypothetical protein
MFVDHPFLANTSKPKKINVDIASYVIDMNSMINCIMFLVIDLSHPTLAKFQYLHCSIEID